MPSPCWVPKCKSNYKNWSKESVFCFPSDEKTRQAWIAAIQREDFEPTKHSRVCAKHFREEDFQTVLEAYNDKTQEYIRVPLMRKRLLPGVIPSIFPDSPSSSESSNAQENPNDKRKELESSKVETMSLQEVKKEECEQISTIQEPGEKSNSQKSECLAVTSNKNTIILLPLDAKLAATTDSEAESLSAADMSLAIKQEPVESVEEPPWLIEKVRRLVEMASVPSVSSLCSSSTSSSSKSSSSNSASDISTPPFITSKLLLGKAISFVTPESTSMGNTAATNALNNLIQKRKINDLELDADGAIPYEAPAKLGRYTKPSMSSVLQPPASTSKNSTRCTPDANQSELCRRTMQLKRNREIHPPAGTSKKSAGPCTFPTDNGENATREMFESLVDGSKSNPLHVSRTSERPGDLFDVFADFIAGKLREMDWDDCAYALRAVLDVVFKAGKTQNNNEAENDIPSPGGRSRSSDHE